jgi:Replication-relaxation
VRCTETVACASYEAINRLDEALVEHARRAAVVPCTVTPRDLAIVHAVWRYRYLTTPQLLELWWSGRAAWAGQRRLLKLFQAGYLDRFRPRARRGSFPWTYRIDQEGLRLLRAARVIESRARYEPEVIYDYRYVLHDVQLNAWVIAWRRLLGDLLLDWRGESVIEPPQGLRAELPLTLEGTYWSVEDLRDPRPRLLRPDAVVEVARKDGQGVRTFFIEYDRTGRPDKNVEKFRRYDAFLCWWWRHTAYRDLGRPPYLVFVCQDEAQRERFLDAADHELRGHHWHPSHMPDEEHYIGRKRILFAVDSEMHRGEVAATRCPAFLPERRGGALTRAPRDVRLPGPRAGAGERLQSIDPLR